MKSKKFRFLAALLMLGFVSGCTNGNTGTGETTSTTPGNTGDTTINTTTPAQTEADITNEDLEKAQTTYIDENGEEQPLNMNTLYSNQNAPHLNPLGDQHVFVAPFCFVDNPNDPKDTITPTDELLSHIRLTFNGTEEELKAAGAEGIYSVSEFYQQSSYGKANFEAYVMPTWIQYDGTAKDFEAYAGQNAGIAAAQYCRDWYIKEYNKAGHGALGEDAESIDFFDADKDGFIDLMWVVYAYPYTSNDTSFWWAYVTYTSSLANPSTPNVKTLGWASTQFMTESFSGYDSHTFIHETGHTFGLDDYYDYNGTWKPVASVDYMDQNLGDHNAFSKFSLGWAQPWVLKEEDLEGDKTAVITLRAFTNSGDCLVLASPNYNNTAFDEYFILELVGPTGLAERDYLNGYQNTTGFTEPGIRVFHVDARAFGGTVTHDSYYTDADKLGQSATDMRVGNTWGGRQGLQYDGDYFPIEKNGNVSPSYMPLLSIIEASVKDTNWTNSSNYNATNSSLFTTGTRLNMTESSTWCTTYMPSKTNLWNKACTTTGWSGNTKQYEIDEDCTANFRMRVLDIQEDAEYGYVAQVQITL